jgi:SEC-C motif
MPAYRKPLRPPWRLEAPCPCGSGLKFEHCCLWPDRQLRVKLPRLTPPAPVTGYAHPQCYLNSTNDCCTTISGEHFISKDVLQSMKGQIEFGGLPWKKPEELVTYGINSLVSNILCRRHNSALSPLDAAAGRTFRILQEICEDIGPTNKSLSRKGKWFLVSGEALELWGLKTLFGIYNGKIATSQQTRLIDTHTLDVDRFIKALNDRQLHAPCGLYLRATKGGRILNIDERVTARPLGNEERKLLVGITVGMNRFEFHIFMESYGTNFTLVQQQAIFHPWQLAFRNSRRQHVLVMTWLDSTASSTVVEFSTRPLR